ncbi:Na+/Pi-cotransporter [Alkaliphilus metalliredigens QYMF]|uniref:Na+/Pi-cotransporter n=2 Tax=Alkaliphilus TaxID=114627 RepID=A6TNM4_ALKMQ|nr:Na+/Pi-cotransporter [Alkaliphilus metalliredigens QYMF]
MHTMILGSLTGLGLFLLGMQFLTKGLNHLTSTRVKSLIQNIKIHPVVGVLIGALITGLLQSSSGATIIFVGLVEARLLTLHQVAPMIMGSNVGSTLTAQLIAFNLGQYAPIIFIIGIILTLFKNRRAIVVGQSAVGFALIFIGITFLSDTLQPLKDYLRFQQILATLGEKPVLGVLMGFSTTAIIQSSSTGIAILQSLAVNHVITIKSAITILLGQNVGTCVTTILASLPLSVSARRAAFIHFFYNLLGVIIFFPLIDWLAYFSMELSPIHPARQIANAHSLFNILCTLLFLPFSSFFVSLSNIVIKK